MTREEYVTDLEFRRALDRDAGLPRARAGVYDTETKEFKPGQDVPPNCQYCYRVKETTT
jgi:hypothetical protein